MVKLRPKLKSNKIFQTPSATPSATISPSPSSEPWGMEGTVSPTPSPEPSEWAADSTSNDGIFSSPPTKDRFKPQPPYFEGQMYLDENGNYWFYINKEWMKVEKWAPKIFEGKNKKIKNISTTKKQKKRAVPITDFLEDKYERNNSQKIKETSEE